MREYFCRIADAPDYMGVIIIIGYIQDNKDIFIFRDEEIIKLKDKYSHIDKPTLRLPNPTMNPEIGQQLIDGLIKCGFKPSKPIENLSELKAVKYHLEDMRNLVFNPPPTSERR